jgi:hypothetical protein
MSRSSCSRRSPGELSLPSVDSRDTDEQRKWTRTSVTEERHNEVPVRRRLASIVHGVACGEESAARCSLDHALPARCSSWSHITLLRAAMASGYTRLATKTSPASTRPPTPSRDAYTFSTALRRSSVDHPPQASHHHHHHHHPSTPSARFSRSTAEETVRELNTDPVNGLHSNVISAARELFGANEFCVDPQESAWSKFLQQFKDPLIFLLLGSAGVSLLVGNFDDAVSIALAIVIVVTGLFLFSLCRRGSFFCSDVFFCSCSRARAAF